MKKTVAVLLISMASGAASAASMLRLTCEGPNAGAIVSVDGKRKGPCPLDVQVASGTVKITASKIYSDGDEKLFEKIVQIGDGVVSKIDVQLLEKKAVETIRAAEGGDVSSMMLLGVAYREGNGGLAPKDRERSFYWALKAAERGESGSMFVVGDAYAEGEVVPVDSAKANIWYKRAYDKALKEAEGGNTDAMLLLGRAYAKAQGVAQDFAKAGNWFHRAKEKGEPLADKWLDLYGLK